MTSRTRLLIVWTKNRVFPFSPWCQNVSETIPIKYNCRIRKKVHRIFFPRSCLPRRGGGPYFVSYRKNAFFPRPAQQRAKNAFRKSRAFTYPVRKFSYGTQLTNPSCGHCVQSRQVVSRDAEVIVIITAFLEKRDNISDPSPVISFTNTISNYTSRTDR